MATAGSNVTTMTTTTTTTTTVVTTGSNDVNGSNMPQWKRDLIQRRRQQSKVLANNGISVKLCSAVIGTTVDSAVEENIVREAAGTFRTQETRSINDDTATTCGGGDDDCSSNSILPVPSVYATRRPPSGGAIISSSTVTTVADFAPPVAYNMRLEVGLSLCSDAETSLVNGGAPAKFADIERKSSEYHGRERNEETGTVRTSDGKVRTTTVRMKRCKESAMMPQRDEKMIRGIVTTGRGKKDSLTRPGVEQFTRPIKELSHLAPSSVLSSSEDVESDSSEELQYGPGIVNKLKSKYLNLTLRETNKNRTYVQRFRRAASLEDLLDRDDEESHEKITVRKYTKRNSGQATSTGGINVPIKTDRYRNASRGNDSIKRARSVETLMRYNNAIDEGTMRIPARPATTNGGIRQESINDHIILVDRTSVKIENRLGDLDRPKPVNKPKRIKPVLAETERPPPDLVKTTMKIFEGSARKLKPKGDVAAKVATFKTINDTFKAQTQKKLMTQKPPLQPKPVVNGSSARATSLAGNIVSSKKIVLPQKKPTAELIETQDGQEEYHIDGVIIEPIVQSVSSVVSKFQQIEKSHSPSPSPEPLSCKLKPFSPANSPEPSVPSYKLVKTALEIGVKSPPITPVLSPRISSPRLQSPSSPVKDISVKQGSPNLQSPSSPVKDSVRIQASSLLHKSLLPNSSQDSSKIETAVDHSPKISHSQNEKDSARTTNVERTSWQPRLSSESLPINSERKEDATKPTSRVNNEEEDIDEEEIVDGPRTISKIALDNISKAGTTIQFNFGDKPISEKTYLPGTRQNGSKPEETVDDQTLEDENCCTKNQIKCRDKSEEFDACVGTNSETTSRLQESEKEETINDDYDTNKGNVEEKLIVPEHNKPIGAICSLGLIKSSMTTMTSTGYLQSNNETKTIRYQKTEYSPPQKQIGIIRPLVSTKMQHPQQNLSNRELEKNLINRVKSIEQPTKVVVSLKSAEEIQPTKKINTAGSVSGDGGVVHGGGGGGGGSGGLWDTKPWNQQNNTMVFNFSNRKDVPDYIENDGLIIRRKRDKSKIGDGSIIVLDATLDASTTDDVEWDISGDPPSPCDVSFLNDNVLINGRSNLSKTPRNHKHRIQFDDTATRTFEYPSEASILEADISCVDGETSSFVEQQPIQSNNKISSINPTTNMSSLLGGGGLASYTPSKVDLTSEGFELGITRAAPIMVSAPASTGQTENINEVEYLKPAQDAGAWGSETTGDLLY